ncbi:phage replication protein [Pseudomonas syringae]|uniref:phage replication protein n=1 Tax=Pseudomonas syringae TaxID=317 RepID=UPI001F10159C|nr:phage replication protein [Pseudomonas syringae]MCH5508842.1 phage replication protein [Pseudomonas syringae pv. syringae]MCH5637655.1 phage replication protein [Pseudomonas syringae pv. syringae]MCH7426788.1 phage replication protein [Pseudomonas syringae pv. syringae]
MQYTVTINQVKALEWGLNSQQALLFAFVYGCPSWTKPIKTDGGIFFALSKAKIIEELPLLTDKPDTAYRMLKALEEAGLIELSSTSNITLFRLTAKAVEWNQKLDGSEKYPTLPDGKARKKIRATSEKNPIKVGKKSGQGSEKSPTNQDTSNQDTNQGTSQDLQDPPGEPGQSCGLAVVDDRADTPRVEIPADMPGPKDRTCKTFKVWANYAMAYRKRYSAWPVWNAKVGGQLGQLVDRLGADVAHHVAAHFLKTSDAAVLRKCHSLNELLANAESYHTQWVTGQRVNGTTARQMERTEANLSAAEQAAQMVLAKRQAGDRNEYL